MRQPAEFTIGQLSRMTGLTIKALRFYHEQAILNPYCVDPDSGYRYYDRSAIERARVIAQLRELDLPIAEISLILSSGDDRDVLQLLTDHKQRMETKADNYSSIAQTLDSIIQNELEARQMIQDANNEVTRKKMDSMKIAGIRMCGKYSECGTGFGRLGRKFGRFACGKPFMLIYDDHYKENDADFEVCMPIRKGDPTDDIRVRTLEGGACLSTLHRGPYDKVGRAYERIFKHAQDQNVEVAGPCREIYIKGPGMIFRGNPNNYLTEVLMPIVNESVQA